MASPSSPLICAGPLLAAEIDAISKALANPKRPLVAIVAGSGPDQADHPAKPVQERGRPDRRRWRIANTFMLAAGPKIGKSLAEADLVGDAKAVIEAMKARGAAVPIPVGRGHRRASLPPTRPPPSRPPPTWLTTT